ncbi:hypothetical protein V5O48_014691 [Marasmius crinis-equi]|uniref:Ribonuclease H1 N-terminal domain-containing protein n=1 Tax=Marasmius crinis-equi TaxID=585013 RepID=A0ABR3EWJ5_9AGAR
MSTSRASSTPSRTVRTVTSTTTAVSPNGVIRVRTKTTTTSLFKVGPRYPTPVAISSDESGDEYGDSNVQVLSSPPPSPPASPPATLRRSPSSSLVSSISSLSLTPSAQTSRPAPPPPNGIPPPAVFRDLPQSRKYYVVTTGTQVGIFTSWNQTSEYVDRVSGACHSKSNSLAEALAEYEQAYKQGTVKCLSG